VTLAKQAHFLRLAVELEIVRNLALNRSDALVADLKRSLSVQQRLVKAGDFEAFMDADNDFHGQFYSPADLQGIWALIRSRSGHIDRLRRINLPSPGKAQDILKHHRLVVRAIEERDPDEAQQQLRTHLSGTLRDVEKIRARYPEYLSD
jgi:DNA-binding GntR family transcriptional regulator